MAVNSFEIIPMNEWGLFTDPKPSVVAGPCSAESEEQVLETAKHLKETGINVYRAGIWKPRTHPGSFEGVGAEGLAWMQRAKQEYGLKIATEVASQKHVAECLLKTECLYKQQNLNVCHNGNNCPCRKNARFAEKFVNEHNRGKKYKQR